MSRKSSAKDEKYQEEGGHEFCQWCKDAQTFLALYHEVEGNVNRENEKRKAIADAQHDLLIKNDDYVNQMSIKDRKFTLFNDSINLTGTP